MANPLERQRVLELYASLVDYPTPGLCQAAEECAALVSQASAGAAAALRDYAAFARGTNLGRLEEIYTGAFELDAMYYPYVGYHLFGETYKRSLFLLGLKERYAAFGFTHGSELADHVAVMLRFCARCPDADVAGEIVREALLPALGKMTQPKPDDGSTPASHDGKRGGAYEQLLLALAPTLESLYF